MRAIAEPFFAGSAHLLGPTFALAFFVVVFALVIVAVLRARPGEIERAAALPLTEGHRTEEKAR